MRKLNFLLGVVLVATVLTSCVKDKQPEKETAKEVTDITLDKTTLLLAVGEWQTLGATVFPTNATNKTVTWTTSDGAIASVVDGIVTGNKAGKTTIIAKAGNYTATCRVTVVTGLEGTTWKGTWNGPFTVRFIDGTTCTATEIYNGSTNNYSGTYTLVSQNIAFTFGSGYYTYAFVGTVSGNTMTLNESGKTIVLTKQ